MYTVNAIQVILKAIFMKGFEKKNKKYDLVR